MKDNQKIKVLVTAVGGELALSVLKALTCSNLNLHVYGCDIYDDVAGDRWCEKRFKVPLASDKKAYLNSLQALINDFEIDVLIPTSDAEFPILSALDNDELNCKILIQNSEEWNRYSDKWQAYQWFKEHNIATPNTYLPDLIDLDFPMIIKPRLGGGSRNIAIVKNETELQKMLDLVPNPIIQELITPDNQEYTAGVFRSKSNDVEVIVMRRLLKFGMTNKAWTVNDADLVEFCRDTILKTNLFGSNNIQFRVGSDGPKVLEINHRFSGTTGIRANFGFNDAEMWIREAMNLKHIPPSIRHGKVVRYMEEIYDFS